MILAQDDAVKLQALNLGAKLYITNAAETAHFFQHLLNLARFDKNYDIRDRARMIRAVKYLQILCLSLSIAMCVCACATDPPQILLTPDSPLSAHARSLFFTTKPAPVVSVPSEGTI
jgi:hypothetical protein